MATNKCEKSHKCFFLGAVCLGLTAASLWMVLCAGYQVHFHSQALETSSGYLCATILEESETGTSKCRVEVLFSRCLLYIYFLGQPLFISCI